MLLKNKVALITGASSGIGKAIAYELLKKGAYCALASRNLSKLKEIKDSWVSQNPKFDDRLLAVGLDVSDQGQCREAVAQVLKRWGRLEILVNNAGYGLNGPMAKTPIEEVRALFNTNFFGACQMTLETLPVLQKSKESMVVMVSSIAGKIGVPWMSYYCASKFAMNAFAEAIRPELLPYGVRALVVMPGPVPTSFRDNARFVGGAYLPYRAFARGFNADDVARVTCRAIEKNKRAVIVGWQNWAVVGLRRFLAPVADKLMAKVLGPW